MGILKIAASGLLTPQASWHDQEIWFDCTAGTLILDLSSQLGLPAGWAPKLIRKADPTSNTIHLLPRESNTRLNHFWRGGFRANNPALGVKPGLYLNLTQNAGRLSYDGVNDFFLAAMPFDRSSPQSQRTVTIPSWKLTPESVFEVVNVNCQVAGQPVFLAISDVRDFCPPDETGGNYHGWTVDICKVDDSPHVVAIGPEKLTNDWRIEPSNDASTNPGYDRGYYYLKARGDYVQLYIHSAGIRVRSQFRASMMP